MSIKQWFKRRFARPVVTASSNPWGTAYKVQFADIAYESSADGTLWSSNGRKYSFAWSERCRRAVRRARRRDTIVYEESKWPGMLANMDPDFKTRLLDGAAVGRASARNSGLLP